VCVIGTSLPTKIKNEGTVAFPWQQWLCECTGVSLHIHLVPL